MEISIRDLQYTGVDTTMVERVVRSAADKLGARLDYLSLVLVDDARITDLNARLLGRGVPTDVIAFEAEEDEAGRGGELIISVETAVRQAHEFGHSASRELCLLAIHGLLHVLGYEDQPEAKRAEMARLEVRLLDECYPPEET